MSGARRKSNLREQLEIASWCEEFRRLGIPGIIAEIRRRQDWARSVGITPPQSPRYYRPSLQRADALLADRGVAAVENRGNSEFAGIKEILARSGRAS